MAIFIGEVGENNINPTTKEICKCRYNIPGILIDIYIQGHLSVLWNIKLNQSISVINTNE